MGATLDQESHATQEPLSNEAVLALFRKIEAGDHSALTILYDKTSRLLFGLVLRILGDRTSAEEALLDIYTYIWKESAPHDPEILPLEWLISIARTRAIARQHWNKQWKRKAAFQARNINSPATIAPDRQGHVRQAIESLVPAQQEILGWAFYSGLSCSEIAAQIGKPIGAVRIHARLGMNKLSELLRPLIEQETEANAATGGSR